MSERILDHSSASQVFDDLVLRIAVSSYMEIEGEELLRELAVAEQDKRYKLSEKEKKKMLRVIRWYQLKKDISYAEKHILNWGRHLSVVFMAVFIAASASTVASAGIRDVLYKLIFQHEKQYTLVKIRTELVDNPIDDIYTWENAYAPYKLPKGYFLLDSMSLPESNVVIYQNQEGKEITFWQFNNDNIQVDSEKADVVQTVFVNGREALLVSKNGEVSVVWSCENTMIQLITEESIDTTLAIAQNVSAV